MNISKDKIEKLAQGILPNVKAYIEQNKSEFDSYLQNSHATKGIELKPENSTLNLDGCEESRQSPQKGE